MDDLTKARRIKYQLLRSFREAGLAAHAPMDSTRRLAERFGVNRVTVQRALQELTQEGELYSVERRGFFIAPRRRYQQVLAVAPFWHGSLMPVLRGMGAVLEAESPGAFLVHTRRDDFLRCLPDLDLIWRDLALVVVLKDRRTLEEAGPALTERGVPWWFYGSDTHADALSPPGAKAADLDAGRGFFRGFFYEEERLVDLALTHLVETGRTRLAVIHDEDEAVGRRRAELARAWCARRGLALPTERVRGLRQRRVDPGFDAWLRGVAGPGAGLFAGHDGNALLALQACRRAGLRCPEDLAVVGVDDGEEAALAAPSLTSVRIPGEDDGARLIRAWLGREEGAARTSDVTLAVRESTGIGV